METGLRQSRRNARKNVEICRILVKEELRARLKQIGEILKKPESTRSEEEQEILRQSPEEVIAVQRRARNRQLAKDRQLETEDDEDVLEEKCKKLADDISSAKSVVMYTGAGISTAASIPDYRGPKGVWTLLAQGIQPQCQDLSEAEPTFTHLAITKLYTEGKLKYVVSQNCDGLHVRSGLPRHVLSELHGNMYLEICSNCRPHVEYMRLFDVTERTGVRRHLTGRYCHVCKHELRDTIVHFGEKGGLKSPYNWQEAADAADEADVIVCLGTSLKVLKKYGCLWALDRPVVKRARLYIVNLQWTPKDEIAVLKINGRCDDVIRRVMNHLHLDVPHYTKLRDPLFHLAIPLKKNEFDTTSKNILEDPSDLQPSDIYSSPMQAHDGDNRDKNNASSCVTKDKHFFKPKSRTCGEISLVAKTGRKYIERKPMVKRAKGKPHVKQKVVIGEGRTIKPGCKRLSEGPGSDTAHWKISKMGRMPGEHVKTNSSNVCMVDSAEHESFETSAVASLETSQHSCIKPLESIASSFDSNSMNMPDNALAGSTTPIDVLKCQPGDVHFAPVQVLPSVDNDLHVSQSSVPFSPKRQQQLGTNIVDIQYDAVDTKPENRVEPETNVCVGTESKCLQGGFENPVSVDTVAEFTTMKNLLCAQFGVPPRQIAPDVVQVESKFKPIDSDSIMVTTPGSDIQVKSVYDNQIQAAARMAAVRWAVAQAHPNLVQQILASAVTPGIIAHETAPPHGFQTIKSLLSSDRNIAAVDCSQSEEINFSREQEVKSERSIVQQTPGTLGQTGQQASATGKFAPSKRPKTIRQMIRERLIARQNSSGGLMHPGSNSAVTETSQQSPLCPHSSFETQDNHLSAQETCLPHLEPAGNTPPNIGVDDADKYTTIRKLLCVPSTNALVIADHVACMPVVSQHRRNNPEILGADAHGLSVSACSETERLSGLPVATYQTHPHHDLHRMPGSSGQVTEILSTGSEIDGHVTYTMARSANEVPFLRPSHSATSKANLVCSSVTGMSDALDLNVQPSTYGSQSQTIEAISASSMVVLDSSASPTAVTAGFDKDVPQSSTLQSDTAIMDPVSTFAQYFSRDIKPSDMPVNSSYPGASEASYMAAVEMLSARFVVTSAPSLPLALTQPIVVPSPTFSISMPPCMPNNSSVIGIKPPTEKFPTIASALQGSRPVIPRDHDYVANSVTMTNKSGGFVSQSIKVVHHTADKTISKCESTQCLGQGLQVSGKLPKSIIECDHSYTGKSHTFKSNNQGLGNEVQAQESAPCTLSSSVTWSKEFGESIPSVGRDFQPGSATSVMSLNDEVTEKCQVSQLATDYVPTTSDTNQHKSFTIEPSEDNGFKVHHSLPVGISVVDTEGCMMYNANENNWPTTKTPVLEMSTLVAPVLSKENGNSCQYNATKDAQLSQVFISAVPNETNPPAPAVCITSGQKYPTEITHSESSAAPPDASEYPVDISEESPVVQANKKSPVGTSPGWFGKGFRFKKKKK